MIHTIAISQGYSRRVKLIWVKIVGKLLSPFLVEGPLVSAPLGHLVQGCKLYLILPITISILDLLIRDTATILYNDID
jgi:hypothetical protein